MIIVNINPEETYARAAGLWQYDYGQVLRIQGLSLPPAIEIHFSLQETGGEAITRIGVTRDGVTDVAIPDSILDGAGAIEDYFAYAFIYLSDESSGQTEHRIEIGVKSRPKPEGYKGSGDDTMGSIMKAVNEIAAGKIDAPIPAKVGQVVAVKSVDDDGKPTEFEAVDQGGGVSDEKIAEAVDAYLTANPLEEKDPTVPDWAKSPKKPIYTAAEVGAEASGTAESKVSEHNVSDTAHNDIRLLVQGLTERLNVLADSDDTTLDQMSEVVAYIKSNKSLIDAITTSKVNVSDIIDNLTTNVSNKPLSAAQGVALKALIDGITIPEKLPNPYPLTFTGGASGSYDGSEPVSVQIPTGGGSEVTEAVKIAEISIDAEIAEATSIELTAEEYPTMKDYNVFWLSLDNYKNGSSPWIQLSINGKVIYKIGNSANNGFRNVIHSRNGYFFAYGDSKNPSLIPNSPYDIDSAISISFISEAWKYVGELSSIKLGSYTKFMQENAKISLYGWNE